MNKLPDEIILPILAKKCIDIDITRTYKNVTDIILLSHYWEGKIKGSKFVIFWKIIYNHFNLPYNPDWTISEVLSDFKEKSIIKIYNLSYEEQKYSEKYEKEVVRSVQWGNYILMIFNEEYEKRGDKDVYSDLWDPLTQKVVVFDFLYNTLNDNYEIFSNKYFVNRRTHIAYPYEIYDINTFIHDQTPKEIIGSGWYIDCYIVNDEYLFFMNHTNNGFHFDLKKYSIVNVNTMIKIDKMSDDDIIAPTYHAFVAKDNKGFYMYDFMINEKYYIKPLKEDDKILQDIRIIIRPISHGIKGIDLITGKKIWVHKSDKEYQLLPFGYIFFFEEGTIIDAKDGSTLSLRSNK